MTSRATWCKTSLYEQIIGKKELACLTRSSCWVIFIFKNRSKFLCCHQPIISSSLIQDLLQNQHQLSDEEKKEMEEMIDYVCEHQPSLFNER